MSRKIGETRIRILNAAWKLLEAGRGSGVRMSDIARATGISRQAVYLHFPTRAELLIATTRHLDEVKNVDARLAASRNAATGPERLDAFIEAWGNYIPEIHGVARALLAMQDSDEAARLAWADRMAAVRHGCQAAVEALKKDGVLSSGHSVKEATDILWSLLSVQAWEQFTRECGWSQRHYVKTMKELARKMLVAGPVEDRTGIMSSCRFDTDRLRVENWNAALGRSGARAALMAALSALLTPAVTEFLPEPMRFAGGPNEIESWVSARNEESDVFSVRDRTTQAFLGLLILGPSRDATGALTVRLGFLLAEKAWGQGYATELVKGLVGWCEKQAVPVQLLGGVEAGNAASAAVLIKAGFTRAADMSTGETDTFRLIL